MIPPTLPTLAEMQPALARLEQHGGAILIAIRHDPAVQNYADVSHGHFFPEEVKAFRAALSRARKKRQGSAGNPTDPSVTGIPVTEENP